MSFEVEHALRDMDQKTTPYLLEEIFHHGDLKVRIDAARELAMLDPWLYAVLSVHVGLITRYASL